MDPLETLEPLLERSGQRRGKCRHMMKMLGVVGSGAVNLFQSKVQLAINKTDRPAILT